MAITSATTTSQFDGFIKPTEAGEIFAEAAKQSAVQSLARRIPVGPGGTEFSAVTSRPTAGWVAEGAKKPTTELGMGLTALQPKKLAAIAVVSAEVVRADPGNYTDTLKRELGSAFATAFDAAALHGTNTPFGAYLAQTTKTSDISTDAYEGVNSALSQLVKDKKRLTGFAFDPVAEPILNSNVDLNGNPLFVHAPDVSGTALQSGRLLGRNALYADGVGNDTTDIVGFAGDWSKAVWGAVSGINFRVSTESTVTINGELVSLFEHNLVAILAEAEYVWGVETVEAFAKITAAESAD